MIVTVGALLENAVRNLVADRDAVDARPESQVLLGFDLG